MIELSAFEKALASLVRVYLRSQRETTDEDIRDACIQRFEYTYELAFKMLKRTLAQNLPSSEELDQMGFRDVIRLGARNGFIESPQSWFEYREKRNKTSHTYNEDTAIEVYTVLGRFIDDATSLLASLKKPDA
jgi:nucleotidyltransferase substrate binding protein (TIGR01987 family)